MPAVGKRKLALNTHTPKVYMNDPIIANEALPVNAEDKRSTIIRVVHNRENPFVQLNKQALWDTNLSLKAVGLWARCMSRPNDWRFCIKELIKHCKEGRKAVDGAMQELIDAGYAYRLEYSQRGEDGKYKTSGVEYVFFEFPATQEEKDQQQEIFKKSFQHCRFGKSRYGNFRKEHLLIKNPTETDLTEKHLTPPIPPQNPVLPKLENREKAASAAGECVDDSSKSKPKREKSDFSPKVRETGQALLNVLLQAKADFKVPTNLFSFLTEVDYMIRTDKRDPQKLIDVLRWGLSDPYQGPWFFCPNPAKKLRQKYDAIDMKMNAKPPKNLNEVDRRLRDKEGNVSDEWKDHIF